MDAVREEQVQAMVMFLEGIHFLNYHQAIREKVKPYEVDGWKACIDATYSLLKSKDNGRYQVLFIRTVSPA